MDAILLRERLISDLNYLGLTTIAEIATSRAEDAAKNERSYLEFLSELIEEERESHEERRRTSRRQKARLPFHKTLEQFDFSFQPSIDEKRIRQLSTLSFIDECETIAFLGPAGVGKTHLAVGLALKAIDAGYSTYFITWSDLAESITKAIQTGGLSKLMKMYLRPKLLIVDEIGYLPVDQHIGAQFFHIVSKRYEKGSIILTSNKSYIEWGKVFGDQALAAAILDRLLHHSVTITIQGESYRLKEKRKAGLFGTQS